jgi:acetylglutamate kinase
MDVIKVGGHELDKAGFVEELAARVAAMGAAPVIVHGGGRAIGALQERLGIEPQLRDGLRVTDAASLDVVQMVLGGSTNKMLVAALFAAGVTAVGLSGVDGGLLRCVKKELPGADLGYVGTVVGVNAALLEQLVAQGVVPVVSPLSLGLDGQIYNVNADEAAAAIAAALGAGLLSFVSNVPGVLDDAGQPLATLSAARTEQLIATGVIHGGMVPKVRAALDGLQQGVAKTRIVDLAGLGNGGGTVISLEL